MKRIAILISGRGSNMRAVLDACARDELPGHVVAVISNEAEAAGLEIAISLGVPTRVVTHRDFESRDAFDAALAAQIELFVPDLVVLAGFMRVLTPKFVNAYRGRLINIHPSLLPAYPGLCTHARALAERATLHGATVHFVTDDLDGGPIIVQAAVPVHPDDTEHTLAARVLEQEHVIYPQAIGWILTGAVRLNGLGNAEFCAPMRV